MSGFTAWQSKLLGSCVEGLVRITGGECNTVDNLRVGHCGRIRLHARGGTQYGDLFVTSRTRAELSTGLLAHEKHHRDAQWRRYGLAFGPMYLAAEIRDVWIGRKPLNRYELAAEQASDWGGGYPRPDGA